MTLRWIKSTSDRLMALLSIVATPLVLFISSTNSLYLKNQGDLGYQVKVLFPFVYLFFFVLSFGLILLFFSRFRLPRLILWGYYLLGPFFLIYSVLHSSFTAIMDLHVSYVIAVLLYISLIALLYYKVSISIATKVLGCIALILLLNEGYIFATRFESCERTLISFDSNDSTLTNIKKRMPNIYHIVFDEYQTDMFELTLSPEVKRNLSNFIYFPENTTLFGRTRMSLASMFLGKPYKYDTPQIEYQMAAYNSRESFLHWLIAAGYETYAFIHPMHRYAQKYFNYIICHKDYAKAAFILDQRTAFRNIWIYANFPGFIAERFIPREDIEQITNQNLLPDSAPLISYASFQRYLAAERHLPDSNRYTFIHLILPHFPNIFHADCSYGEPLANGKLPKTSALEQSKCATELILQFVACLKDSDRFDKSMIVICADHGSRYKVAGKKLVSVANKGHSSLEWNRARSRALLLVKPPVNRNSIAEFKVLHAEATLMDIAPTVLDSVGIKTDIHFAGVSLIDPEFESLCRQRYYHFYKKKGSHGWTDEMTRFIIEGDEIIKDEVIKLTNNPPKPALPPEGGRFWRGKKEIPV